MQEAGGDAGGGSRAGGAESQGRRGVGGCRVDPAARVLRPLQTTELRVSGRPSTLWGRAETRGPRPKGREADHAYTLNVPFPSALEAEIARGSLAPDAEPHRGAVGKELTVSGSVLAVCWRAEDCRLLRISIVNFLDQLSLVMRTMQRFGPPVAR